MHSTFYFWHISLPLNSYYQGNRQVIWSKMKNRRQENSLQSSKCHNKEVHLVPTWRVFDKRGFHLGNVAYLWPIWILITHRGIFLLFSFESNQSEVTQVGRGFWDCGRIILTPLISFGIIVAPQQSIVIRALVGGGRRLRGLGGLGNTMRRNLLNQCNLFLFVKN